MWPVLDLVALNVIMKLMGVQPDLLAIPQVRSLARREARAAIHPGCSIWLTYIKHIVVH